MKANAKPWTINLISQKSQYGIISVGGGNINISNSNPSNEKKIKFLNTAKKVNTNAPLNINEAKK